MNHKASLEEVLEIFLITSNRSACLDKTLKQLKDSPFALCRFTILDNCSTDETPKITARYQGQFPEYHLIRHPRNIGGTFNYLRAVELSTTLYTWILCDDDDYDFTHADEVINAIESCNYDLIYVGPRSSKQFGWSGFGSTTASLLIKENAKYHRALSFYPSIIFKSEQFDSDCYINAPYMFPSMIFIQKSANHNFKVYVSKYEIVIRFEGNAMEISPLYLFKEWVMNAARISDKHLRKYVIEQMTDEGFVKTLFFWIALEKAYKREGFSKRIVDIYFGFTALQRIKLILLFPVILIPIPTSILFRAREIVYRLKGHKDLKKLPPVHIEQRQD